MKQLPPTYTLRHNVARKPILKYFQKARFLAIFTGFSLIYQLLFPVVSWALTGGPTSPDFSSFEPVATTNMVNEFTGQFVYNIPVLEIPGASGGGYALSLSYHSGDGPEAEASWVGYGWTLNPGSINRTKRGLPDDYNGQAVTYYNDIPRNWTVAATGVTSAELFSDVTNALSANAYTTVRYNNYKGFGFSTGFGLNALSGTFSLGFHLADGNGTFSAAVNPAALLSYASNAIKSNVLNSGNAAGRQSRSLLVNSIGQSMKQSVSGSVGGATSKYINYLLTDMTSPYNMTPYEGSTWSGSLTLTTDPPPIPTGISVGINASYSYQENKDFRNVFAYGYMYSGQARNNDSASQEAMMDYTVENPSTFNQRDKYLPVPTSTPDAFFVSGEGVGGAFRMYNDRIGIFSPNYVESKTTSHFFGVDGHIGADIGVGGEALLSGEHNLRVRSSWQDYKNGNNDDFWFVPYDFRDTMHSISEGSFFRFNNDLGGKIEYDDNNMPLNIGLPDIPSNIKELKNNQPAFSYGPYSRRNGRSSYIGFHTNKEIKKKVNGKRALAYCADETVHTKVGRDNVGNANIDDLIGEISVTNEDGNNYVYGLPVYANSEKNLQHGLSNVTSGNYIVQGDIEHNYKKVGEMYGGRYVTSYLLTQITTPDYVDINLNGPDKADFGGYTRFTYVGMPHYQWRMPYTGMYYHPGLLSDKTDNMGSYQSGDKEVYYLDTIETKTHFAVFYKERRKDGFEAAKSDEDAANGTGIIDLGTGSVTNNTLYKLNEICLYAKSDGVHPAKLIKRVMFQYDYTAWPDNPNSYDITSHSHAGLGKLTLKRVWFEYNGVVNAAISPYEFEYEYPNVPYPAKYQGIQNEMISAGLDQTPGYTPYIDCWGNYQSDGENRRNNYLCSPSQLPTSDFDAAAWQLKRIILPSGGEIHVQYEQNSYSYVQDRPAMLLVPLTDATTIAEDSVYELNTNAVGITSMPDKQRLAALINSVYAGKKIYFKFLYTLIGTAAKNIGDCNADYVDGYADFLSAWYESSTGNVRVSINTNLPRKTCLDFIHKEVGGKITDGNCEPDASTSITNPGGTESNVKTVAIKLFNAIKTALVAKATACKAVNADVSYLRIPVWRKLGGGVRVKRLMMYNKGIDPSSETLYGTEYLYENENNGESFGVATNEPYENREENPLVDYMDKREVQSKWDRLFQGRDREQFEGPLSMNALPAASIGYSRIIKKNIHEDKYTGTGYTVIDYNTVKDYPFDRYYTSLGTTGASNTEINKQVDGPSVDIGLFAYSVDASVKSSQSYCFIQNQMHGQLKSLAEYPGTYNSSAFYSTTHPPSPVAQYTYEYFEPGEQIPMINFTTYGIYYDLPGKEMDITVDRRSVADEGYEMRFTGDVTAGYAGPVPIPYVIGFPVSSSSNTYLNSIVTNKTIHYPAILKRSTIMKDGYIQYTDNVAFDPLTTKPVVVSTYDGYNGLMLGGSSSPHNGTYTQNTILASSQYQEMGQKGWNEGYKYYTSAGQYLTVTNGATTGSYNITGINIDGMFHQGDLIALHGASSIAIANVTDILGTGVSVVVAGRYNSTISTSPTYYKAEIIRSANTNQLSAGMGGFTAYGSQLALKYIIDFLKDINDAWQSVKTLPAGDSVVINMNNYNFSLNDEDPNGIYYEPCNEQYNVSRIVFVKNNPATPYAYSLKYTTPNLASGGVPPGTGCAVVSGYRVCSFNNNPGYLGIGILGVSLTGPNGFNFTKAFNQFIPSPPHTIHYGQYLSFIDNVNNQKSMIARLHVCGAEYGQILKANVLTYDDYWDYDTNLYKAPAGLNIYEKSVLGKWRPSESYVYNAPVTPGSLVSFLERNYKNAGTIPDFKIAPWAAVYNLDPKRWVRTSKITAYSPHGFATEEQDPQNIYSTAKYGYNGILPYLVAQNAPYKSTCFESFENYYSYGADIGLEDGLIIPGPSPSFDTTVAHTGRHSYVLSSLLATDFTFENVEGSNEIIRFWALIPDSKLSLLPVDISANGSVLTINYLTRSGEWALFEARYSGSSPVDFHFTTSTKGPAFGNVVRIDDILIQPEESKTTSYVYDTRSLKLSAALDDQNFATYYQYNGEGKLVRKRLETERGVRTIEEAQYNKPKKEVSNRAYDPGEHSGL